MKSEKSDSGGNREGRMIKAEQWKMDLGKNKGDKTICLSEIKMWCLQFLLHFQELKTILHLFMFILLF